MPCLFDLEVYCRLLAVAIVFKIVLNRLPFVEGVQPSTLQCANMHEHIYAATLGQNESVTFSWIEPLHSSLSHPLLPDTIKANRIAAPIHISTAYDPNI